MVGWECPTKPREASRSSPEAVHEWRQAFRENPLVERTPTRWVLRVPERVWADLCNRAGVRDDLRPALAMLHETESVDEEDEEPDDDVERVTLVLGRV
ncbi:hypothetical protein [Halobacterium wangiae]|uniref:hypothetical protein n=1 Tax=Halobacterium wangiae TaxID=2902623 RepID=UPI001E308D01|nr:hypothetical protein [Halobacterium wangiae]